MNDAALSVDIVLTGLHSVGVFAIAKELSGEGAYSSPGTFGEDK
jgi:hypothetical protein